MTRWGAWFLCVTLIMGGCATTSDAGHPPDDGPNIDPVVMRTDEKIVRSLASLDSSCAVAIQKARELFWNMEYDRLVEPVYFLRCVKDDAGYVLQTEYRIRGRVKYQTTLVRMFGP